MANAQPVDAAFDRRRSWIRHLTIPRQPRPAASFEDAETSFIELCSGRSIQDIAPEASTYLVYFQALVRGKWRAEWDDLMSGDCVLPQGHLKAVRLCHHLACVIKDFEDISINRAIRQLQVNKVLRSDDDVCDDPRARTLVFSLLGWLSLLYIPAPPSATQEMRLAVQGTRPAMRSYVATDTASRPLDELLRSLGEILPKKMRMRASPEAQAYALESALKFEVSYLNVAALKDMANMQIIWVDSLSAHLEFDPATPSLSIFKCPSFCKMHQTAGSLLDVMLIPFYEEDEKPSEDFSAAKMLSEVVLSYTLLFRSSRRSRQLYQTTERARASLVPAGARQHVDPYLDELCGHGMATSFALTSSERGSYDADADFPIFKDRLRRLQDYMKGVQPHGFRTLWRDKRDLRLWYTIWVVIILTVIGLVIAVVSMFLAAVQVSLAEKAYNLQIEQNAQGG